jgi:hypothetical protein
MRTQFWARAWCEAVQNREIDLMNESLEDSRNKFFAGHPAVDLCRCPVIRAPVDSKPSSNF